MAETNGAVPDFMRPVVDNKPTSARVVAERAVLALNASMMGLYDASLETFKQNMRDRAHHRRAVQRPGRADDPLSARPSP